MIIARYLSKQILLITSAITFVLLMILIFSRFLKYLAQASQGELDPGVLLLLMSYRIPEFLQLILPVSLLLGILLAYGRMYAENEMTVLIACGISRLKLLAITLMSSLVIAGIVAALVLVITPWGLVNTAKLLEAQKELNEFDLMVPGVFQNMSRGTRTTYVQDILKDDEMRNVFMMEQEPTRVTVANSAKPTENAAGKRSVLFENGSVTQGVPGIGEYNVTEFAQLGIVIPARELSIDVYVEENAMSTGQLLSSTAMPQIAELQWRLSLIILIPVLTLLALPLSKVNPRQGRFGKIAPAMLIYILYFGLLVASRDSLQSGDISPIIGLWWVHLLFIGLGALLFYEKTPSFAWFTKVFR